MRFKPLFNILGSLLFILGCTMLIPLMLSWVHNESDFNGFLHSFLICITLGLPMWYFTRYKQNLTNRDGFAIVTFSWILAAIVGSLPFYLSESIPNVTDAFFESMSGITTTGATIIGNTKHITKFTQWYREFTSWNFVLEIISSMDWWYGNYCFLHSNITTFGSWGCSAF